jgi:ATP-dependent RNA/DNA helicase IGHMBP2
LQMCANNNDVCVIHGPPGTGKTTTLVESIIATVQNEVQTLVVSSSNVAVDLLTELLSLKGISVLRIGNPVRVSENLQNQTLDAKIAQHSSYKDLKQYRKQADEYRAMANKYKRKFGNDERIQRNLLRAEANQILKDAKVLEQYIISTIHKTTQVYCTTLIGSSNEYLKNLSFETVFIDEAAQALEPAAWVAISKANKVVMAGDHLQLPPTIKNNTAAKLGLSKTLLEKAIENGVYHVMLNIQYRMSSHIMKFSNQQFYNNQLLAHNTVQDNALIQNSQNTILSSSFQFIDTAGCGYNETLNTESLSVYNTEEATFLLKHLSHLLAQLQDTNQSNSNYSIGIISPYSEQIKLVKELIANDTYLEKFDIKAKTIDGFQGQEKDIIYISMVRSNTQGEIGFLADTRRLNVALTRAKKKLVVIADSSTISSNSFYLSFIDFCIENHFHESAWEYAHL